MMASIYYDAALVVNCDGRILRLPFVGEQALQEFHRRGGADTTHLFWRCEVHAHSVLE